MELYKPTRRDLIGYGGLSGAAAKFMLGQARIPGPGGNTSSSPPPSISYVKQTKAAGNIATIGTFTISVSATTGNLLMVGIGSAYGAAGNTVSVSDGTNTYVSIANVAVGFANAQMLYAKNITGGSLTLTLTTATIPLSASAVTVVEFSGLNASTPLIGSPITGTNTSSTSAADNVANSGNLTSIPTGAIIICWGQNYYAPTWAAGATNPVSMAVVSAASNNNGSGSGNLGFEWVQLASGYTGEVSINPGSGVSTYGSVIGAAFTN